MHINSLRPSGGIWRHRSGSTLPQGMACCLTVPRHYLNQLWENGVLWYPPEGNFTRSAMELNLQNVFEKQYFENYCHNSLGPLGPVSHCDPLYTYSTGLLMWYNNACYHKNTGIYGTRHPNPDPIYSATTHQPYDMMYLLPSLMAIWHVAVSRLRGVAEHTNSI